MATTVRARPAVNSIVAAATILSRTPSSAKQKPVELADWQETLWRRYKDTGELRFGVGWGGNAVGRVNLIAAVPPTNPGDEPTPVDLSLDAETGQPNNPDHQPLARYVELVAMIAGNAAGQTQLLASITKHLMLPGICYVLVDVDSETDTFSEWSVLSQKELRSVNAAGGELLYQRKVGPGKRDWVDLHPSALVIKIWRQDLELSWMPDSPARAVIDTLEEIRLLSASIRASAESRLRGAGLLILPSEAVFPDNRPPDVEVTGVDVAAGEVRPSTIDGFVEVLVEVASLAQSDPESPAAKVPLTIQIPGDYVDKVKHVAFSTPFDEAVIGMRDAAIRRLALGIELPPEVLLGLADVNHWNAWQVEDSTVTLMVEPLAELICHALTTGYLEAAARAEQLDPKAVIVWYDTSDLRTRPDLTAQATEAYDRIELSGDAYLREVGLNTADKPADDERTRRLFLDVAKGAPTLAPLMFFLAGLITEEQFTTAMAAMNPAAPAPPAPDADTPDEPDAPPVPPPPDGAPRDGGPPEAPPEPDENAALVAAADGLVYRALERAGSRLRSELSRNRRTVNGAVPDCEDPALLHTMTAVGDVSIDRLLEGAWRRVPVVAGRYRIDADALTATLDTYTRALLATGHAHELDRLSAFLGATARA